MKKLQVEGWKVEKLGDVSKINYGYTEKASIKNIGPKFLRITDIQNNQVDWESVPFCKIDESDLPKYILRDGDIVFARTGATTGKSFLIKNPPVAVFASYLIRLQISDTSYLLPEYLILFFQTETYWHEIQTGIAGSAQGGFNASKLAEIEIPIPPLPEQQRIVSLLDETFAGLAQVHANAERNLVNAREVFEAYLQNVFENKDDNWEEKTLQEVVDENCTLSYGIVQPGEEYPNGLPVIRPTDLTKKVITLDGLKRIDPRLADSYKRTTLTGDELLLCVRGSTGTVSVTSEELKGANVTRGIVPIRFNSEFINQEFGYYLLVSSYVQKQIKEKTYGAALMQINIGDLREILTPFPPLEEQRAIVGRLDGLAAETSRLEAVYQSKLEAVEELRKSVLGKAFEGEL